MVLEYDKNDRLYKRTIYFVETFTLPIFHLFPLSPKQEEWLLLSKMKSKVDGIFIYNAKNTTRYVYMLLQLP